MTTTGFEIVNLGLATAQATGFGIDTLLNFENITGSNFDDTLTGDAGNNLLDGGSGIDTAVYSGVKFAYTITKTVSGYTVSGGADGTDTLTSIEKLAFSDQTVLLKGAASDFNGDVIFGGAGNDVMTGGLGADLFRFTSSTEGNDSITDFTVGIDKIQLSSAGFASLAVGALPLSTR